MEAANRCACNCPCGQVGSRRVLIITWQRLIADGQTCPRCGSTEGELDKAVLHLKDKLDSLGIEVILEKKEITLDQFKKEPTSSNSILFNGQSLEAVLGAATGQSQCCEVCGDEECRTIEIDDQILEVIPVELIVKAGLSVVKSAFIK